MAAGAMTWTTARPTEQGTYCVDDPMDTVAVVRLQGRDGLQVLKRPEWNPIPLARFAGLWWYGPIPDPPEEEG